ncbi:MAG: NADH-quinone oxidoreductase subunit C [Armatimonadetes bacterium]|nr:NADH-quinone oxidoreductase subunit C [Armatimonadota bacterium]
MVNREALKRVLSLLKENFGFAMLIDATAVDWLKRGEPRFEVVYHLLSLSHRTRLRIKVAVASTDAWVPCICDIYPNASPYEREIWDMFGIFIDGHKNLKRILTYEEFPGHPLRKDFPLFWQPGEPVEVEEEKNDEW